MTIFRSFAAKKKLILKYALISNTCFGVLLRGVGDLIQQTSEVKSNVCNRSEQQSAESKLHSITYKTQSYDWNRTSKRFGSIWTNLLYL